MPLFLLSAKLKTMKKTTSWNKVAGWYDSLLEDGKETYQSAVILPNLLRVLEIHPGEKILDLACGQGFFSRAFHTAGARVIGIDISRKLIEFAKKNTPQNIEYYKASVAKIPMVPEGSMDKVVMVLAAQNIENIEGAFYEASRTLKRGGTFSIVLNHPAFRIMKGSAWGTDGDDKIYRRVDFYLSGSKEKIQMHPGSDPDLYTISFNRPLQVYSKALKKNGFAIRSLEEWISNKKSQPGKHAREEDRMRKEIPLFLFIEAIKL